MRILLLGASGTIGRATRRHLIELGHTVICHTRQPDAAGSGLRFGDLTSLSSIEQDVIQDDSFDAIISCMASRSGEPKDAWAVDYQANANVLEVAKRSGIPQYVMLSAICVQKPKLAFQKAKLAFENELKASGLNWSIVRPTAFFKSLSGQIDRLRKGKPFLLFGDGNLTACKPISDRDLAHFIAACLTDADKQNTVLPIGGPGPSMTPRQQGELLFDAIGRTPKFSKVPIGMMDAIIGVLSALGLFIPPLKSKAELARIGRYYATESMLVWNEATETYQADDTPEWGRDTLWAHYQALVRSNESADLGAHKVF